MSNTIFSYNLSLDYQGSGLVCSCFNLDNLTSLATVRGSLYSNFENSLNADSIKLDIEKIVDECKEKHKRKALTILISGLLCEIIIIIIGVSLISTCNGFGCEMPGYVVLGFGTVLCLGITSFANVFSGSTQKIGQIVSTALINYFRNWKSSRQDDINVYIHSKRVMGTQYHSHHHHNHGTGHHGIHHRRGYVSTYIAQETMTIQIVKGILSGTPQGPNTVMLYASGDINQNVQNQPIIVVQQQQQMPQYGQVQNQVVVQQPNYGNNQTEGETQALVTHEY